MDTSRANLGQLQSNTKYIFLTIIFVILSIIGVFLFFRIKTNNTETEKASPSTETEITPSPSVEEVVDTPFEGEFFDRNTEPVDPSSIIPEIPPESPSIVPSEAPAIVTPKPTVTVIPSATSTPVPKILSPTPINDIAIPTPVIQTYDGTEDGFTLSYVSSRKVQKMAEPTGHRVVFYRSDGNNIAIHVGSDWSWSHPGRELLNSYNVSGQPAFRYDITAQTLVDVKYGGKFYTIQCLHSGLESLKTECEQLITSFKFL